MVVLKLQDQVETCYGWLEATGGVKATVLE